MIINIHLNTIMENQQTLEEQFNQNMKKFNSSIEKYYTLNECHPDDDKCDIKKNLSIGFTKISTLINENNKKKFEIGEYNTPQTLIERNDKIISFTYYEKDIMQCGEGKFDGIACNICSDSHEKITIDINVNL